MNLERIINRDVAEQLASDINRLNPMGHNNAYLVRPDNQLGWFISFKNAAGETMSIFEGKLEVYQALIESTKLRIAGRLI